MVVVVTTVVVVVVGVVVEVVDDVDDVVDRSVGASASASAVELPHPARLDAARSVAPNPTPSRRRAIGQVSRPRPLPAARTRDDLVR